MKTLLAVMAMLIMVTAVGCVTTASVSVLPGGPKISLPSPSDSPTDDDLLGGLERGLRNPLHGTNTDRIYLLDMEEEIFGECWRKSSPVKFNDDRGYQYHFAVDKKTARLEGVRISSSGGTPLLYLKIVDGEIAGIFWRNGGFSLEKARSALKIFQGKLPEVRQRGWLSS